MSIEAALSGASAKPAGKRPYFMTPEVERVLAITMSIAQELAVARARLDTLERMLERKGIIARVDIEQFAPSTKEADERRLWTQEYIARILRIVQQEGEAGKLAQGADVASEDVATAIAGEPSTSYEELKGL